MKVLLVRTLVLAVAFLVVDALMDTVTLSGGFLGALALAIVYGLLSAALGTILRLLSLPIVLLTAGLFEFVINAVVLLVTDWLTDWIRIDSFLSAIGAAFILTAVSVAIGLIIAILLPPARES